jgi:hypothetical protein
LRFIVTDAAGETPYVSLFEVTNMHIHGFFRFLYSNVNPMMPATIASSPIHASPSMESSK